MKVVACLAYYAETEETLQRCVSSLAGIAQVLVALEGRWEHFPEVGSNHPGRQREAVTAAAMASGVVLRHSRGTWDSQVDKRTDLMRKASALGDWLLVIDADEWVVDVNVPALHEALATTPCDVARVDLRFYPTQPCAPARAVRRIYRASTGVHLRTAHNGYLTSGGVFLHGDPAYVKLAPSDDGVAKHLALGHDKQARSGDRVKARLEYLSTRRRLRFESWQQERTAECATP